MVIDTSGYFLSNRSVANMARIRKVEIKNFRGIKEFTWFPTPGINCLIGPGDSGKSSILDAIDYCLGARRNIQFSDADFHRLNVEVPISISVTVGELDDGLKNLDTYGMYVRSFDAQSGTIEDEPGRNAETVLTMLLTVSDDLEPSWSLVSERALALGQTRNLNWNDRVRLAPTRIGVMADYHLGWGRGSVLNSISEERADASAALTKAAREARAAFGDGAQSQLSETLGIVSTTAKELGVPIGEIVKAMLDAHSASFSGGTISLHDEQGIPLRGLGIGSTRLLIAGLQRKASAKAKIILIDELEHGLEPHRIIRLLGSLGAKEEQPPLQAFMTTHSPVALRELSGSQLFVVRASKDRHESLIVGTTNELQSTIRLFPEAFLATSVVICEGASEVGLLRGLDQYCITYGLPSICAHGVSLVDVGGGDADKPFKRAKNFHTLGYRTAIVRDDDKKPTEQEEKAFIASGGKVVAWREGRTLEDELFLSLTNDGIEKLLNRAVEIHGDQQIDEHIKTISNNTKNLLDIQTDLFLKTITLESRAILGKAARIRKAGWFKSVTWMEAVACDIVGPDLINADPGFRYQINEFFSWARYAGE